MVAGNGAAVKDGKDHKMSQGDLASIMAKAHRQAELRQVSLGKNFYPRLARYARELLGEGVDARDVEYAAGKVIEGQHSPFLLRSFVAGRLGSRGGTKAPDAYDQAVQDFPDYSH
jgi:hypothetical protein